MGHTEAKSPFETGPWDGRLSQYVELSRSQLVYILLLVSRQDLARNGLDDSALNMTGQIKAMETFDVISAKDISDLLSGRIALYDVDGTWDGSYPQLLDRT